MAPAKKSPSKIVQPDSHTDRIRSSYSTTYDTWEPSGQPRLWWLLRVIRQSPLVCWVSGHRPLPRNGVIALLESAHCADEMPPLDFAVCTRCGLIYCVRV